ncbi:hypothetical protein EHS13_20375 [Paenibacillus psychroresistens]|uniref:Uncharacterized protein n=1 Tax=Paenibacillus psychroresistens TaxID=1778678 RepID=A0A6B8RNY3_9BACL|nr:hypothetical protein [Paenibacillus psychroresistens]QGQ97076.1 hypothetical protein EHS13_20375 [Paenibacillus psychroresistens]
MSHGQLLKSPADFENAIMFQIIVSITQDGEHMGSGQLIKQSQHCIHTVDAIYFKGVCEFKVCSMVH